MRKPNGARTFLSAKRSGDIPVPHHHENGGWKTPAPLRETDKALKEILEKLGI